MTIQSLPARIPYTQQRTKKAQHESQQYDRALSGNSPANAPAAVKRETYTDNGLSALGPNADPRVTDAWSAAAKDSGVNPMHAAPDGKLTHLSTLFTMAAERHLRTGQRDLLGDSVDSAVEAARQALQRMHDPAFGGWDGFKTDEEKFLRTFLQKLGVE